MVFKRLDNEGHNYRALIYFFLFDQGDKMQYIFILYTCESKSVSGLPEILGRVFGIRSDIYLVYTIQPDIKAASGGRAGWISGFWHSIET